MSVLGRLGRYIRCRLLHSSTTAEWEHSKDGEVSRSRLVTAACGQCGRPLSRREREVLIVERAVW